MRKNILIKNALLVALTTIILAITALSVNSAFVKPQGNDCYYCHRTHYEGTTNPNHTANNFPTKCDTCHRAATGAWRPASSFNHAGITSGCYDCHKAKYDSTTNPNHTASNFPTTCEQCHRTNSWRPATFSHTKFPLVGVHATLQCSVCHQGGKYTGLSSDCYSCHKAKYDATTNPNHATAGYSTDCTQCHKASDPAWKGATFSHTKFPLTGLHTTVDCAKCHLNNQYAGTPKECSACHWTRNQKDPWKLRLGQTCQQCHNTSGWKPANWNHSSPPASYALQGIHNTLACMTCHTNYQQVAGKECYSCHKARYDATTNPNHATSGFPTTCEQCHKASDTAWTQGKFNHSITSFPLTGLHITATCAKCHLNGQYKGTPRDCYSCHWTRNQRDPWKLRLGQTCEQCHNTSGWKPANWSHSSPPASYALTGKHAATVCATCHVNYQRVAGRDCNSCHKAKYDASTNPKHSTIGFGTTCEQCHNTTVWSPANWSHSSAPANWALTGFHTTLTCTRCHVNSQQITGRACYSCHKAKYDASTNPKHSAAKIGTVCENCHNTSAWTPGKFNHATDGKGAISSKMANNKCSSCHPNNSNYTLSATKCLGCHKREHNNDPCAQCHYTVAPWDKTR